MKTAVITGGTGAIGETLVSAFSKEYRVVFTYNSNSDRATEICCKYGCEAVKCDVTDRESVKKLSENIGRTDVLINNAGISYVGLLTDMSGDEWDKVIGVNLTGTANITSAFLPKMISYKNGNIINISSIWGRCGASCEVAYSASKAGIIGFTMALAKEVGPSGIRVNCIAPGMIESKMNDRLSDDEKAEFANETPLCRMGKPNEVAQGALYLASADFVTGQVLGIDGGVC